LIPTTQQRGAASERESVGILGWELMRWRGGKGRKKR